MVIGKISDALFSGDAASGAGAATPVISAEVGAAGLMVTASQRGGAYTEVERQGVAASLMKLLHLPGPKAATLRAEAEARLADGATAPGFAAAAAALPSDDRDGLVQALWSLTGADGSATLAEHPVLGSVADAFGMSRERLDALRPR